MSTFTPPSISEDPPILFDRTEMAPGAASLMRFYKARPAGVNVYLYKLGSVSANAFGRVTEDHPVSSYDSTGTLSSTGWSDIEVVFWGGHAPTFLLNDWEAVLVAAGYTVIP